MDVWDVFARVALAALLGGVIGFDRELKGHSAGLRTNILVSAAAAVFADVSIHGFAEVRGYDPSRVASNIVSGIGFLGAGAIFAMGGRPRGLTTAAALWASAAVGLSVGVGRWRVAVALVMLSLITLFALNALGDRLLARRRNAVRDLYVVVLDATQVVAVQQHLQGFDVGIRDLKMVELGDLVGVDLVLIGREADLADAVTGISDIDAVQFASSEEEFTDDH
ncbi:MAG: MgtC/SapB family protein [Acidimicrobiia bacterium]|nr:MgtC/SapB family protein [Acidimicrobiia bacterium]